MRRGPGTVIMVAVVAVLTLDAGTPVAGASVRSATPGWRVVKAYTQCDDSGLGAITATRADVAWAAGSFGQECHLGPSLVVARWEGHSWKDLRPPSEPTGSYGSAVAALSRSYAWIFVVDRYPNGSALLWQDGHWRSFPMPGKNLVTSAAVFSRSDAWAFNQYFPFAARFNGHAWRRVPVPVSPQGTATVGSRSIWAVGPLPAKTQPAKPPYALAHWSGRWRTIPFPKLNLPSTDTIYGTWVVPDKSVGAWVLAWADYPTLGLLLHWTGSRWTHVTVPYASESQSYPFGPLARDGNGGVWLATYPPPYRGCDCPELAMVHYSSAGTWTRKFVPIQNAYIGAMRLIPGTRSVWAAGSGGNVGIILKYGP